MEFQELVAVRHSVRSFRSDPVPRELIEQAVHAAALAPSSMNSQPWHFYVTTGKTRMELGSIVAQSTVHLQEFIDVLTPEKLAQAQSWYSSLGDAPVVIAITMKSADGEFEALNRHLSVGAAVENLLLAATDVGLAACNVTFSFWVNDELGRLLGVKEGESIASIIALGYPEDTPPVAPPRDFDVATYLD